VGINCVVAVNVACNNILYGALQRVIQTVFHINVFTSVINSFNIQTPRKCYSCSFSIASHTIVIWLECAL